MTRTLQQLAQDALSRAADRPAIQFDDRWISWGEIRELSDAIESLLRRSGIHDDAAVAFIPRNRPWAIAVLLSLIAAGRNIQMIYGFQSAAGVARDIERLGPAVLVAGVEDLSGEVRDCLAARGIGAIVLAEMTATEAAPLRRGAAAAGRHGPKERQIEIFTSGTTGPPKQFSLPQRVIAEHHLLENRLPFLDDAAALETPPFLLYYPVGNISGLYSTLPPVLKGQRLVLIDRFSIEAWREYVVRYRPAGSGIPTSYFQVLLAADIPPEELASLKVMGAGAAPLDPEIQRAFEDKYGIPVLLSYGATEFGGPVTGMTLEDHAYHGRAKLGTVGRPLPGARIRAVAPEDGAPLGPGQEGLLEVVSPRIGTQWIRTTDIGMVDADGFVFHKGRADGAIVRGGFKILPETIEKALKLHPAVADAVVVGVPDKRLGEVPGAAIILQPGAISVDQDALETHLRQHVMKTHIPADWIFCSDYPRTISAKIDRQAVKAMFGNAAAPLPAS